MIKNISLNDAKNDLENLKNLKKKSINSDNYLIGLKYLDYFFFKYRLETRLKGYSFYDVFKNKELYNKLIKRGRKLNPYYNPIIQLYDAYRLYIGSNNQFRPSVARNIYLYFKPTSILDFSAGWGGRMLGALSIPDLKYTGYDTNKKLKKSYDKIITSNNASDRIKIKFMDSSKEDFSKLKYDMVFTSPPYYNTEIYENMPKYKSLEDFYNNFLFKVIFKTYKYLKSGGYFILNIPDDIYYDLVTVFRKFDKKYKYLIRKRNKDFRGYENIYVWKKP